jgi:3-deoxy-7-phosphoheptulonate synthase
LGDYIEENKKLMLIAGPCSVEDESFIRLCIDLKVVGATHIRGGIYKPRTSPYLFQGIGDSGIPILMEAKKEVGLPIVSEVLDLESAEKIVDVIDIFQIGTRNMQNFSLLKSIGKFGKPVLLKRGMAATIDEFIYASDYLLEGGCKEVILCERGIRTFNTHVRTTLDVSIISAIKKNSDMKIVVDPSHSAGHRDYVQSHALAGIGAGCDGLIVEVHQNPKKSITDPDQAITVEEFKTIADKSNDIWKIAK